MIFVTLPLWVRRQNHAQRGADAGAPEKPEMLKKIILNSILSLIVLGVVYYFIQNDGLGYFRNLSGKL
jgi:predicted secreted protein